MRIFGYMQGQGNFSRKNGRTDRRMQVEPEQKEAPPPGKENSNAQVSYQTQRSLSSLSRLSGKLPAFGVNVHEIDPVNYENPNLDILKQAGTEQYIISYFAGEQFYRDGNYDKALAEYTVSINNNANFMKP